MQLPTMQLPTIQISIQPDGQLQVRTNVQDQVIIAGMLARASFVLQSSFDKQQKASPIMLAKGIGLPRPK